MAWTAEDRRRYVPAVQEMVRQGMLVRLASSLDTIDPPGRVRHLARDGIACRSGP